MDTLVLIIAAWLTFLAPSNASSVPGPWELQPADGANRAGSNHRRLRGRFLHITDIHPDPFYQIYSSTEEDHACHSGRGPAGYYGAETSDCDSPLALVNATFKWLDENLKDSIDFVIWTGDSARHDNDETYPRNQKQVAEQNQMLVDRMLDVFGASPEERRPGAQPDLKVPVVPSFGNNDILPHNIFEKGPNRWTKLYQEIWRPFIPEEQRHGFNRGGWFYVEVIPNKLAVFSLNTMFFFDKNSAVDGCASHKEPGYEHFEWLRIQLQFMRQRGMKAIISGHVPPARNDEKFMWDETCWQKYTLWMRQYRDVIVGSMYGHMNIEHFILQDFKDIDPGVLEGYDIQACEGEEECVSVQSRRDDFNVAVNAPDYLNALRELWAGLPTAPSNDTLDEDRQAERDKYDEAIGGRWAERFSISLVTASVVPNYFSVLRVFEYNITGMADATPWHADYVQPPPLNWQLSLSKETTASTKKKKKKRKFTVPLPPSKSSPPGPAYSPQSLTWIRYVQYFANNTRINNDLDPEHHDPSSFSLTEQKERAQVPLASKEQVPISNNHEDLDSTQFHHQGWNEGNHADERPGDSGKKPNPMDFQYEAEYDTGTQGDPYGLYRKDGLTLRSWVELASKIGEYEPGEDDDSLAVNISAGREDDGVASAEPSGDMRAAQQKQERRSKEKKKREKEKEKEKGEARKAWYTFVSRAVTGTLDQHELRDRFST